MSEYGEYIVRLSRDWATKPGESLTEITRCRDCVYRDIPDVNHCCKLHCFIGDDDFFCKFGRKEDD